jgi:2-polyprenyl-6-methoxyphenol hydroxylase-like FAD-dependent oxidoreductase
VHYHTGASILSFENTANGINIELSGKARRSVDLVVCADGAQSETRRRLLPEVMPRYAGYIACRGSLPEADVPDHLASFFDDKFSFSDARSGGHILDHLISGASADTTAGNRLLNWVWYVHASEAELPELLTDKDGRCHHSSLPQGGATEAAVAALRDHVRREIHPRMAELVASTPDPFIHLAGKPGMPSPNSMGPTPMKSSSTKSSCRKLRANSPPPPLDRYLSPGGV